MALLVATRESRRFLAFREVADLEQEKARRPAVDGHHFSGQFAVADQLSAVSRLVSRDSLRAATFRCSTPLATPRANSGCTRFNASRA